MRDYLIGAALLAYGLPAQAQSDAAIKSRLSPELHACETSPENSGTLQQAICYRDELIRQEQRLNLTWEGLTSGLSPTRVMQLRIDERRWIERRDQECRYEQSLYINSTAAYMHNLCLVREDIRRTMWLEAGGRGPFAIKVKEGP